MFDRSWMNLKVSAIFLIVLKSYYETFHDYETLNLSTLTLNLIPIYLILWL